MRGESGLSWFVGEDCRGWFRGSLKLDASTISRLVPGLAGGLDDAAAGIGGEMLEDLENGLGVGRLS